MIAVSDAYPAAPRFIATRGPEADRRPENDNKHGRSDLLRHIATWDDASRQFNHVQVEERNARALASLPSDADVTLL